MNESKILEKISNYISENSIEVALDLIVDNENELQEIAEFWNLKSIICIKTKEYSIALNCLNVALEKDPNNIDYLYNLAYLYELRDESYNAYDIYIKLLSIVNDEESREKLIEYIDNIESQNQEIIIKNADKKFVPSFGKNIYEARENVVNSMVDSGTPLVSVYIQAYNNLEKYTKRCVECVLEYTQNVDYELILVDNGSEDGTFEYFKTVKHPRKKIVRVTKNIGSGYGGYQGYLNCSGKYITIIANDVFVTKNWLRNMLRCAISDKRIGIVNPALDYVGNFQSIDLKYKNFDDMQKKAAEYNVSDPKKWEERLRLVTMGTLLKKECLDIIGFTDYGFFHDFSDDDLTFRIRRAGYKAIFCKDTFICHAGKIADKGVEFANNSLMEGRKIFQTKYNGLDAWSDIQYEVLMMQYVNTKKQFQDKPKILGVDVGCGAPILEVKNKLRNNGIFKSKLYSFSTEAKYFTDLKSICSGEVIIDRIEYFKDYFDLEKFDYIVISKPINKYKDPYKLISNLLSVLNTDGQILLKVKNTYNIFTLLEILGYDVKNKTNETYCMSVNELNEYLKGYGYYVKDISAEFYNIKENFKDEVEKLVNFANNDDYSKSIADNYVLNIIKNK